MHCCTVGNLPMFKWFTRIILPAFFVLLFLPQQNAKATHIMGGNATYECIGPDSFLVTLALYRDCLGASLGTSQTVTISSPCGQQSLTLNLIPGSGNDITPLCPGWPSPCSGAATNLPAGVEEYLYQGIFVVPPGTNCDQWSIVWSSCCRNSDITTGSNDEGFYLASTIYTGGSSGPNCNTSPQFLNVPVPYICVGETFNYNHGVFDPDGDSLVFSLVACEQGANQSVTYNPPLNAQRPLYTSDSIKVDPLTGTITFTPSIAQVGVLCIQVDEFRNGVKIGEVTRDIQMIVVQCANDAPTATGFNGSAKFDTAICPGQSVSFDIYSNDSTPFQTVSMNWNQGIPQGTFTTTGGQYPTGNFSWTPTTNDIGFHFFTVQVVDDGCPIVAQNYYAYSVEVRTPNIDLGPDLAACDGDTVSIQSVFTSVDFNQFTWTPTTGIIDPTTPQASFSPSQTTTYTINATNGFCSATDTIRVNVDQRPTFTFDNPSPVCRGDSATIRVNGNAAAYQWSTGQTGSAVRVLPFGTSFYQVTATSDFGCETVDTLEVEVVDLPTIDAGFDDEVCLGDSITLIASGSGVTYEWLPISAVNPNDQASGTVGPTETTTYTVVTTDANGCANLDTVTIAVNDLPTINALQDTAITLGGEATLTANFPNASSYAWVPDSTVAGTLPTDEEIIVSPPEATTYTVTVIDQNGCRGEDTVRVSLLPGSLELPNAFTPNGDQLNDVFYIISTGAIEIDYFRVYNRWGQVVHEAFGTGTASGWDGTKDGKDQPAGVYTWVVKGLDKVNGEQYLESGNVTLIR